MLWWESETASETEPFVAIDNVSTTSGLSSGDIMPDEVDTTEHGSTVAQDGIAPPVEM